jgi:ribonuclease HI
MKHNEVHIFVDGASRGNPGPASIGALILDKEGETLKTLSERIGIATNNIAEYFALIYALQEAVAMGASIVHVKTDSQLMARQFTGEYETREPHVKLMHRIVKRLAGYFERCTVTHIPREENREADRLAARAVENE